MSEAFPMGRQVNKTTTMRNEVVWAVPIESHAPHIGSLPNPMVRQVSKTTTRINEVVWAVPIESHTPHVGRQYLKLPHTEYTFQMRYAESICDPHSLLEDNTSNFHIQNVRFK